MRLTPHKRLLTPSSLIKATVSTGIRGARDPARDVRRQHKRKPWRCQRSRVSGLTITTACFHARTRRACKTRRVRSVSVKRGRLWVHPHFRCSARHVHYGGLSTRKRSKSKFALPYILLLTSFKRFTWPSTCPCRRTVNYTQWRGWRRCLYHHASLPSPRRPHVSAGRPASGLG